MSDALATLRRAQVEHARAVLEAVLQGMPADRALSRRMRNARQAGARDRRWVSRLVYGVLREVIALRQRGGADPGNWLAFWLQQHCDADSDVLKGLNLPTAAASEAPLSNAARRNWPDWLDAAASAAFDAASCDRLAGAMRAEADVDLRVNLLRGTVDKARKLLLQDGVACGSVPGVPAALRLERRQALQHSRAWRDGWVEPQDVGSQLVCALVDAQPGERIADWCAGAGGKALALAAAQSDRGEIVALDTSSERLARIAPRAQRLGVRSVTTRSLPADVDTLGLFDAVLVDAPCTGSGTLRRRPELVLSEPDLAAMTLLQGDIIRAAARHVRPGGRLVYATCSFLPQENEMVVGEFMREFPDFTPVAAERVFGDVAHGRGDWLHTGPDSHGSDAFSAIRLQRSGAQTPLS